MEEELKLEINPTQISVDKGRYQRLVERMMYLAHKRPDLAYAFNVVSLYTYDPGKQHMKEFMRILRYLKGIDDRRSASNYFTIVEGNLVTWWSMKHNVVTWPSAEAKYKVARDIAQDRRPCFFEVLRQVEHE
ncbi:unnamed protein product [Prunus armeniaca]